MKNEKITMRINGNLKSAFADFCKLNNYSMSEYLTKVITEDIREDKTTTARPSPKNEQHYHIIFEGSDKLI